MTRTVLIAVLLSAGALAQVPGANTVPAAESPSPTHAAAPSSLRTQLLQQIDGQEALLLRMESAGASGTDFAPAWLKLGLLYEDVGWNRKAEDVFRRAIQLVPPGPSSTRAAAVRDLSILHIQIGRTSEAMQETLEAMAIYQALSDEIGTAACWSDLADLYLRLNQYKKALMYAQKAVDALGENIRAEAQTRIEALHTLAFVYCTRHQFSQAVELFRKALDIARAAYGDDGLSAGIERFMVGVALWRAGDLDRAAEPLRQGMARIRQSFGWGHPVYLQASAEYAAFLRQRGRIEEALATEREARAASSVVDARSLTGLPQTFASAFH